MKEKAYQINKRTNRQITKSLMVVNVKLETIDILQITNRRFMYNPQNGFMILGDEIYGKNIRSSHSQEFYSSKAEGCFDDYLRGWIGTSAVYSCGIIHFAPAISIQLFDKGIDMLQMLTKLVGVSYDTMIRGFCNLPEEKIGDLLPLSFK